MPDLIDRQRLIDDFTGPGGRTVYGKYVPAIVSRINAQPSYQPAHIDREEWTAEWVTHDGYTECSKCEHWYDSPEYEDDGDRPAFCPSCGRAMKPEAWAELEKRMGKEG